MLSKESIHSNAFWTWRFANGFLIFLERAKNESYGEKGLRKRKKNCYRCYFLLAASLSTPLRANKHGCQVLFGLCHIIAPIKNVRPLNWNTCFVFVRIESPKMPAFQLLIKMFFLHFLKFHSYECPRFFFSSIESKK